jgi:hypothetical protein
MSFLGSLWRRLLTGNPPAMPHRWRCKACEATWETRGSARIPKGTFYTYAYPPIPDGLGLRHHREELVKEDDAYLSRRIDCGPVTYVGQMVHPLDPRARSMERQDLTEGFVTGPRVILAYEGDDKEFVVPRHDGFIKRGETGEMIRAPFEFVPDEGAFENQLRQLVSDLERALGALPSQEDDISVAELNRVRNAATAICKAYRAHFEKGRR